ncbi:CubicO group peptidase (beta-lactamase class C family) [Parvularcula dongshanensis]|uniref:CubicO group peptidase (Beta-lactamase class C family) n=2 Tax=Parvularcula dongshanensis TaxID=1173995 RepID=A0A840I3R6_9PROT|nr:CubicO group peptidase (beta-lactamase class C family) [Parvularcula dongshanensis]
MTSTSFLYPSASQDRVAARYDATGEPVTAEPHGEANAAANLMTTAGDYARFLIFVMGGGGLAEDLAADMLSPQIVTGSNKAFGLGWEILEDVRGNEDAI